VREGTELARFAIDTPPESLSRPPAVELARKDASISLRLPAALLATLKANAARANMPTQRLIRMMIEAQLEQAGAKPKRKSTGP
jgi:predicted DNA binding CopG/RHH family protein